MENPERNLINIRRLCSFISPHSINHFPHSDPSLFFREKMASPYLPFQWQSRLITSYSHPSMFPSCLSSRSLSPWPLPSWLIGTGSAIERPHLIRSILCWRLPFRSRNNLDLPSSWPRYCIFPIHIPFPHCFLLSGRIQSIFHHYRVRL